MNENKSKFALVFKSALNFTFVFARVRYWSYPTKNNVFPKFVTINRSFYETSYVVCCGIKILGMRASV